MVLRGGRSRGGGRKRGGRSRGGSSRGGGGRGTGRGRQRGQQRTSTSSNRRSGGDGGRFAPRAIGAPAGMESALTDGEAPFLNPRPRRLQPVPLEFGTVGEWCSRMAHNLLAEFWHIYREGSSAPSLRARVLGGKQLVLYDVDDDGMSQHLLLIDRTLHLVSSQLSAVCTSHALPRREEATELDPRGSLVLVSSSPKDNLCIITFGLSISDRSK